ncbi:MAG TPA: ATP-binding protein [Bryobacteraceae bacterium]|nr:ATP-binding protein [Bryobacteraceae bacterium]
MSPLQPNQKLLAVLLESASQAILAVDRSGRIVLANHRAGTMFGYGRDELVGAPVEMLLPVLKRAGHVDLRDNYFNQPHLRPMGIGMDLAGLRKDATEFPVEISLNSVETEEGIVAIAFVSDISQRKQLEEQLMQAQKMDAVGRLAGGVAHDFNNMLTVISGYDRMILDELPPHDALHAYAEEILKAADRAAALTNHLLAFSRRQVLQARVVNVNAVIAQNEEMLRRAIGEDVELRLHLSPDAGSINADPGHIEQALVNLSVNAREAMPVGGRLVIETANTRLDETYTRTHLGIKPGEFVMIAVSDNGRGMDSEIRQLIFEPFFTTKERGKGAGLGLATVYGMVKQCGGDIWVSSEPGKGTTFKLYFPRVSEPSTAPESGESGSRRPLLAGAILVVEDEQAVRELTVRMLQQLGYTILAASGGVEALELSSTYPGEITLLVTDVVMPSMSGRQVADALALTRPNMKVLYLSGYTENTVFRHGVGDVGVEFLPKPFNREALDRKIREILRPDAGRP